MQFQEQLETEQPDLDDLVLKAFSLVRDDGTRIEWVRSIKTGEDSFYLVDDDNAVLAGPFKSAADAAAEYLKWKS